MNRLSLFLFAVCVPGLFGAEIDRDQSWANYQTRCQLAREETVKTLKLKIESGPKRIKSTDDLSEKKKILKEIDALKKELEKTKQQKIELPLASPFEIGDVGRVDVEIEKNREAEILASDSYDPSYVASVGGDLTYRSKPNTKRLFVLRGFTLESLNDTKKKPLGIITGFRMELSNGKEIKAAIVEPFTPPEATAKK